MTAILTLLGVIVGALITAGTSFLLEQRRQKWASEERKYATAEKKYLTFAEKRLNALQNGVQLCDFVDSIAGSFPAFGRLSDEVQADWRRIRRETVAHGALMPASVQEEFKAVLRIMPFEAYAPDAQQNVLPTIPPTQKLRTLCLEAILRLARGSGPARVKAIRYRKAMGLEVSQVAALEVCSWTDSFLSALATELSAIPRRCRVIPGAGPS